eukprot:TCONS_00028362-protein
MGIDSDRFAYGIPQDAHCFLCCSVLECPVEIVECGHYFCLGCLEEWREKHDPEEFTCPYCGIALFEDSYRKSTLLWNLIQNMNVNCKHKSDGCDVVYKYGFESLHEEVCVFQQNSKNNNNNNGDASTNENEKCPTCKTTLNCSINSHDCVKELAAQVKQQKALLTNLEHENQRLVYKLSTCEKRFLEERTEMESQYYIETLRFNKEIRELRTRVAHFQGEMGVQSGQFEQEEMKINLEKLNGSLGFNIIGGLSKTNSSAGIFVSRVAEGGAADQPGKLVLHDQILEVDHKDLRQATHEMAVDAFRAAGNPVKMLIKRQVRKMKPNHVSTQTETVEGKSEYIRHPIDIEESPKKSSKGWFDPMSIVPTDLSSNENKEYDSAYDTLNKSSRYSQETSTLDGENTDDDTTNTGVESSATEQTLTHFKDSVSESSSSKRHSTFLVVSDKENFDMSGQTTEGEADFEFEYVELVLRKDHGKIGVNLYYDETDASVYVGDVEDNSPADLSGKIMVGDQIVQINQRQVNNVEQAHQMFEANDVITLVVARAVFENNTDMYDEEAEETDLDMLDCILEENESVASKASSLTYASSASSKSSDKNSPPQCLSPPVIHEYSNEIIRKGGESTNHKALENSPSSGANKESKLKNPLKNFMKGKLSGGTQKDKRAGSQSDDSLDFNKLPRCDSNSSSNNSSKSQRSKEGTTDAQHRSNSDVMKARLKEQKQQSKLKAYMDSPSINRSKQPAHVSLFQAPYMINTGAHIPVSYHGVSNMAPVYANQPPRFSPTPLHYQQVGQQRHNMSGSVSSLRSAMKNSQMNNGYGIPGSAVRHEKTRTHKRVSIDPHPGWNETEKRVWEEFKIIQSMEKENGGGGAPAPTEAALDKNGDVEAEWRVRRSKDGKHIYIKKSTNSTRSKVLKDRAQQIDNERCGLTTDDDAFTVYQGQYWSRDQRKKQLSRHNERRKRLVQKAELKATYENKTEKEIAEMAQRKMTLPVFDNFVTIEEILSQRNRSGVFSGPVHVTTI